MKKIISARLIEGGDLVFLTKSNTWSKNKNEAHKFDSISGNIICDLFEVNGVNGSKVKTVILHKP